jgi:hypothetical protein
VPVSDLVSNFGLEIPDVVDGSVLAESIGTALELLSITAPPN